MEEFVSAIKGVFDNLNPFNIGNLTIYFSWLVVYTFTLTAIWRSKRGFVRLFCFIANQLFSIGIILSWALTVILAYTYWIASLGTIAATLVVSWYLFRTASQRDAKSVMYYD